VKVQLDFFHAPQLYRGTLTALIKELTSKNLLGHVQAGQIPYRGAPCTKGELNFDYLFELLDDCGYDGYVGLEHN